MARSPPPSLATRPRDLRPGDAAAGERVRRGEFRFLGLELDAGPGGDPWDRACPSRGFAAALHGFGWLGDLLALGEPGAREALRLWLGWRRLFGKPGGFSWSGAALERRVFNLTCAAPALVQLASEAEGAELLDSLGRQAAALLDDRRADPSRELERLTAAALAGAALAGPAGDKLLNKALPRLEKLAPQAVLPDGVHATRSPQRGLELLFDLLALDDALSQRGRPAPVEALRAVDRLGAALRFFTLSDGRLPSFQGGEAGAAHRIAVALALDAARTSAARALPYGGYQRLESRLIRLIADVGAPAQGPWSVGACAQPGSIEVEVGGARLIAACAWSASAEGAPVVLRGPAGGSCLGLGEAWPGLEARGEAGDFGPRLTGDALVVTAERQESAAGVWLDLANGGWRGDFGLEHTRRLFLDLAADEVRGEDQLAPVSRPRDRRPVFYLIRFQLGAGVTASVAVDGKSAVLKPAGAPGWSLRSDAAETRLESVRVFEAAGPRQAGVVVLAGLIHPTEGVRVRWKLSRDEG